MTYIEPHMREALKDHILVPHIDTEQVKGWYLKRPKEGRMMSTLILFTVEGIIILGDLTPKRNGVISDLGYGIGWFSGDLSEDYLCEKFLRTEFVPELAVDQFKEHLLMYRRNGSLSKKKAREGWDKINKYGRRDEVISSQNFYELYREIFDDTPEIGYGYNPGDAGWLCAIQQKFAELYRAELAEQAQKAS